MGDLELDSEEGREFFGGEGAVVVGGGGEGGLGGDISTF